jgi:hypothetical protein
VLNEEKQPQKPVVPVMTAAEQEAAMKFLKRPDLMDQIIEDLETIGHVGEENRKLLGYLIRTLQSRQKLTQAVPIKDPNSGKIKTMTFEVEGPIAYLETTTNPNLNHENATRCFEIFLDESIEQTRRIHQAQREAKTVKGILRKTKTDAVKTLHHNAQRLLKTVPVHNPYVLLLDFPADSLRTRRDHERFLSLIEAVTFLNQYQRPVKQIDAGNGEQITCIESTVDDYAIAYRVAREILGFSLDDLKKHARDLLDRIQEMVKRESRDTGQIEAEITFTRRQIREFTGWPDYQIKTYIKQLEDLEYLILQQVKTRGQFEYRLNDPNQPKTLKGLLTPEELKNLLLTQNPSITTGTTGRNGLSTGQSQAGQDLADYTSFFPTRDGHPFATKPGRYSSHPTDARSQFG